MTIRITTENQHDGERTTVSVEGTLTRESAELLAEVCWSTGGGPEEVAIDLAGVHFVDSEAASILRCLARFGARLERPTFFVSQILEIAK
jgi:anti-anti-sigma regulatory factor